MNYKIKDNKTNFEILETTTDQIIKKFPKGKYDNAKSLLRHLNLGGSFDGFTPTFFLREFKKILNKPKHVAR